MPQTSIPYFLFYRADWLAEAKLKPPVTYDEFIQAAKAISKPPDRYGLAMRGQTYSAIQVILPIWASAGVKFVDDKGNVDFDSPAAIARHREVGRHATPRTRRRNPPRSTTATASNTR